MRIEVGMEALGGGRRDVDIRLEARAKFELQRGAELREWRVPLLELIENDRRALLVEAVDLVGSDSAIAVDKL